MHQRRVDFQAMLEPDNYSCDDSQSTDDGSSAVARQAKHAGSRRPPTVT